MEFIEPVKLFEFGPVVRNIPQENKTLYLTFDDGPCDLTPDVLKILRDKKIKATFFVVGRRVKDHLDVFHQIKTDGHTFGNHSLDHLSRHYFTSQTKLLDWIKESEDILVKQLQMESVGFRPPAGICTPPLQRALDQLKIPLILWKRRFYDSVFSWTPEKALKSLEKTEGGDIILLHDRQRPKNREIFLKTLEVYIDQAKVKGFSFESLRRKLCESAKN